MDLLKAIVVAVVVSGCVSGVIGAQGTSAGPLAIDSLTISDAKVYWSWPVFFCGAGLTWGILLLQR